MGRAGRAGAAKLIQLSSRDGREYVDRNLNPVVYIILKIEANIWLSLWLVGAGIDIKGSPTVI